MALFKNIGITIGGESFSELTLKDKEWFDKYLYSSPFDIKLWSMNFTYVYAFGQSKVRKTLYRIIDEMMCVFNYDSSKQTLGLLFLPMGDCDKKKLNTVIMKCFKLINKINGGKKEPEIREVTDAQSEWLFLKKYWKLKKSPFGLEHVYDIEKVANKEGKDFEYIRRKYNKFTREYPEAIFRRYEQKDRSQVMKLKQEWKDTAGEKYFRIIDSSYYDAIVDEHVQLKHDVFVIEIANKIVCLISGEVFNEEMAWCFNRKPLNNIDGLSEYSIIKLCEEYKGKSKILEDGGDGNSKGLQFFKERFKPVFSLQTYALVPRKEVEL